MQVFTDDGAFIDACIDGRKREPVVVMIHGFPFTREIWEVQAEALARAWCVLRPDLRGAGKSSVPDGPYLMERLAADVAGLLDALALERVALIGHSMGGYVALAFARMFTERLARLALVASRLRADTSDEAAARREVADRAERENSMEPIVEAYLPRLLCARSFAERRGVVDRAYNIARQNAPAGAAATLRGMALRACAQDIAEDLDVPMMMIAGARDGVLAIEEARSIAAQFPRGQLVVCNESGHLPMLEESRRVTEALEVWLRTPTE